MTKFDSLWLLISSIKDLQVGLGRMLSHKPMGSTSRPSSNLANKVFSSEKMLDTNFSAAVIDDIRIHDTLLTCCPTCYQSKAKKPSSSRWTLSLKPKEHTDNHYELKTLSSSGIDLRSKLEVDIIPSLYATSYGTEKSNETPVSLHDLQECEGTLSSPKIEEARNHITQDPQIHRQYLCYAHLQNYGEENPPSQEISIIGASLVTADLPIYPESNDRRVGFTQCSGRLKDPFQTVSLQSLVYPEMCSSSTEHEYLKRLVAHHTLMKPSGINVHPVDKALLLQPVLPYSTEPSIVSSNSENDIVAAKIQGYRSPLLEPVNVLPRVLAVRDGSDLMKSTKINQKNSLSVDSMVNTKVSEICNMSDIRKAAGVRDFLSANEPIIESDRTVQLDEYSTTFQGGLPPLLSEVFPVARAGNLSADRSVEKINCTTLKTTCSPTLIDQATETHNCVAENNITTNIYPTNVTTQKETTSRLLFLNIDHSGALFVDENKGEHFENESNKTSWKNNLNKEYKTSHAIVPQRSSLLDKEDSRPTTKSIDVPVRKHVLKQIIDRSDQQIQSPSSTSGLASHHLSTSRDELSESWERYSTSTKESDGNLSLQWLRDIIRRGEPLGAQLTALPHRPKWHMKDSSPPRRSYQDDTQQDTSSVPIIRDSDVQPSETFTRTINDLEDLLNEALQIASQAAENNDQEYFPNHINDAMATLQECNEGFIQENTKPYVEKADLHPKVSHFQRPKDAHSLDSIHESLWSIWSNSSYSSSANSILEGQYFNPDELSESASKSVDNVTNFRPTAAPGSPPIRSSLMKSIKETGRGKFFGRVAITVLSNAMKNSSGHSKPPRVPGIQDGNTELKYVLYGNEDQHKDIPYKEHSEADEIKSPTIPSRKSSIASRSIVSQKFYNAEDPLRTRTSKPIKTFVDIDREPEVMQALYQRPIQPRESSLKMRPNAIEEYTVAATTSATDHGVLPVNTRLRSLKSVPNLSSRDLNHFQKSEPGVDFFDSQASRNDVSSIEVLELRRYELKDTNMPGESHPQRHISGRRIQEKLHRLKHDKLLHLNLRDKSHVSIRDHVGFSLSRSHKRQPVARDWSPGRKRFVASVACLSTASIGVIIGIYAGEVPSIQYYIADFNHYAILGNVFFFIGIAITSFLSWPLPLLHGRKPYILTSMTIALPLLFPQAIAVGVQRSPYVAYWRVGLILPRALMGCALGFANMNFMATLTDLFGASLMSGNPHQERVDQYDVRRHGGGLGVWLGIWTWCYMGSIGLGFFIGAWIINSLSPDWGFYITIILIAIVLFLNVLTPEVRRSAYRRSVTEIRTQNEISRRLARGEITMHRLQTGPKWWGEEFYQGILLSRDMIRQPGFLIMSLYVAWIYGQIVLTIVLLASLMSKYYRFTSPFVGLTTMAIPLGALLAIPFQKASLFSRARHHPQRTDSMTFDRKVTPSSHLIRRAIFTLVLPFAGLAFTLSSGGSPTPFILPVLFAGLIGFLSNLAIAECNGMIMETFDTSDLQPGMTGRPRGASGERTRHKRTNYSSFPRISSAFAITQSLGFLTAAAATGTGGVVERSLGAKAATGVMAGILLVLTILFLGVLIRWKQVQIIPRHRQEDIEMWERQRQVSVEQQAAATAHGTPVSLPSADEERWRPVIIGNPSGMFRRMSILELGHLSRWSEIRRKNRLVDVRSYAAQHPNLATLGDVRKELGEMRLGSLRRHGSQRGRRSLLSWESASLAVGAEPDEAGGDLGERRLTT